MTLTDDNAVAAVALAVFRSGRASGEGFRDPQARPANRPAL